MVIVANFSRRPAPSKLCDNFIELSKGFPFGDCLFFMSNVMPHKFTHWPTAEMAKAAIAGEFRDKGVVDLQLALLCYSHLFSRHEPKLACLRLP